MSWLKWKKALATLDVVVTGVEFGHGRRRDVLSDYTFAVQDDGKLLNIGKAYSGLTDREILEMTEYLQAAHDSGFWPIPVGRAVHGYRGRFQRHPEKRAARERLRAALSSNRPHPDGKTVRDIDTLDTVSKIWSR